jgi:uncharacterized protein
MYNLELLESIVQQAFANAERGHDYWHAMRVVQNARYISSIEGGNISIIEASAWAHDMVDEKFTSLEHSIDSVNTILLQCGFSKHECETIIYIISNISFKGGLSTVENPSIELQIVQDADRIDAMGAIGIARAFHYGGFKNRELYNPTIEPEIFKTESEYRNSQGHTINHFYEKLFTLYSRMNTATAKRIAKQRHEYMETFVSQFLQEWNGNFDVI